MRKLLLSLAALVAIAIGGFAQSVPSTPLKVGDTAPNFTLKDQNGRDVSLRDFRGKKTVVLAFYIYAFSGV